MLSFKAEVRIVDLSDPLVALLRAAAVWSLRSGVRVEVNSIDDGPGIHKPGTLHGWSLAADLDTDGDRIADTRALGGYLQRVLPAPWDVVIEDDHIHAEWDMHRGALAVTVS